MVNRVRGSIDCGRLILPRGIKRRIRAFLPSGVLLPRRIQPASALRRSQPVSTNPHKQHKLVRVSSWPGPCNCPSLTHLTVLPCTGPSLARQARAGHSTTGPDVRSSVMGTGGPDVRCGGLILGLKGWCSLEVLVGSSVMGFGRPDLRGLHVGD